jgi:hypothetical protein
MNPDKQDVKPRLRVLIVIPILLVVLWAAFWGGASALTPRLSHTAIARMMEIFERLGIGMGDLSFKTSRVSPLLNRIELGGVYARLDLDLSDKVQLQSTVDTQAAEVDLGNPQSSRQRSLTWARNTPGCIRLAQLAAIRPLRKRSAINRKSVFNATQADCPGSPKEA